MIAAAILCLASVVYHEARGEPIKGQQAVALVVMNRANWQAEKVCSTVKAKGQFPWMQPGLPAPKEKQAWHHSQKLAQAVIDGEVEDFTNGATYFLGKGEHPSWQYRMQHVMTVGSHRFYKPV